MAANRTTRTTPMMPNSVHPLASLKKGESATIIRLAACEGQEPLAVRTRLLELGFAPGERVRVVAEAFPQRDPIAVRVGNTTFALRRHEAALIDVERVDR